ncbi:MULTISPECIES: aromatase/cyclase [unclassified Streptomyces]|uniref:aromatase/cyclase n=1 Tax=unclassified Streptomyces TaxID=2593676 RepID=UPI0033FD7F46
MSSQQSEHTSHEIGIDAPADTVYRVIAEAAAWPQHFAPTLRVEQTPLDGPTERLRIWATANDEVKTWTSLRVRRPEALRVEFRQEVSSAPVASMSGTWTAEARPEGGTRLALTHDFTAVDDDPGSLEWIRTATDRNSGTELANIKAVAERWHRMGELVFSFEDSVTVKGEAREVYDFLYRAAQWPGRLPHVARLDLREDVPGVQAMSMDTLAKDGSVHTTESIRICLADELKIAYKQLVPPSLMAAHTGEWSLAQTDGGVLAVSRHTVTVNEANITKVLGESGTVASARDFIRRAAGGNSLVTLQHAKEFVEAG